MPKLWEETIQAHRDAVRGAVIETTWRLATEHGLRAVTMSQIAASVGIGRATLYKYFPDVETILVAGHEQHVSRHLEHLQQVSRQGCTPEERLRAVMAEFARICHERARHGSDDLGALVHKPEGTRSAEARVHALLTELVEAAAASGVVRRDVPAAELAHYCAHALAASAGLEDDQATSRLVEVCLRGMTAS